MFKELLKVMVIFILAVAVALGIIISLGLIFEWYYLRIYSNETILYIANASYMYLVLFIILFVTTMINIFLPNLFVKKEMQHILTPISRITHFIQPYKILILFIGIPLIIAGIFISLQSYNVFYEDEFISVHIFRGDKTYTLDDIESYSVGMTGLFNNRGYSMKLHMKDGRDMELFGNIEITTDAFDQKYNTYGYKTSLDHRLLVLKKMKSIRDKDAILKDCEGYDEPYRTDVRSLVGE